MPIWNRADALESFPQSHLLSQGLRKQPLPKSPGSEAAPQRALGRPLDWKPLRATQLSAQVKSYKSPGEETKSYPG